MLAHTVLAVPYVVIVMTSTLKGFDERLEQASMNLGAGRVVFAAGNGSLDRAMMELSVDVAWAVYPNPSFEAVARDRS